MNFENKIMDGKRLAFKVKASISSEISEILKTDLKSPKLAVILLGNDPASEVYVRLKKKDCKEVGIESVDYNLPDSTTQNELLDIIDKLNQDKSVSGILVQLPLPASINEREILKKIDPAKDVDGFHPVNVGLLSQNVAILKPCTPLGSMRLLDEYQVDPKGKNAVVIGRSNIVGKPLAMMLLNSNATVTIAHSQTKDLKNITNKADILIAAIGKARFVTKDMVKEGAIVIDVGVNRLEDGSLVGDADFDNLIDIVGLISPSPGGVGPMTRAMLLENTLKAYKNINGIQRR